MGMRVRGCFVKKLFQFFILSFDVNRVAAVLGRSGRRVMREVKFADRILRDLRWFKRKM